MEYLWNQSITVPLLEFLQGSPTARRDLRQATTLEGGKKRRKKKIVLDTDVEMVDQGPAGIQVMGLKSSVDAGKGGEMTANPENWGSFMIPGRISDSDKSVCFSEARICIDAGSEAELITPAMVEALKLKTIPMKRTPWPRLKLKTSVGELRDILGIARGKVRVGGVEVDFYACIIPEQSADNSEYDLLLGIPWLSVLKAAIHVKKSQVTIISPNTGERITLNGPRFSSPDFRKLFLEFPKVDSNFQRLRPVEETEEEDLYTSDDEFSEDDESEDDESRSDEGEIRGPPSSPRPPLQRVNARSLKLMSCDGVMVELSAGKMLRYVTPGEYLRLYGDGAKYSEMAKHFQNATITSSDSMEAAMIADHEDRGGEEGVHKPMGDAFHMSERTIN